MKTIILAGGLGSRLGEETATKPKPMVEIGNQPILWHIMSIYASFGFNEFVLALGYKANIIKDYFLNFCSLNSDLTVDLSNGNVAIRKACECDWIVHLVDTGLNTQTGGRIKRLESWIGNERFMATYGDGLGNVNIAELVKFHESHGKLATVTAVRPPARFGNLDFDGDHRVTAFLEKPQTGEGWINGGFFVLEPGIFDYIDGDDAPWEHAPLQRLARDSQLVAFRHTGFWQPMDTLREKHLLESYWNSGRAPWKVWS